MKSPAFFRFCRLAFTGLVLAALTGRALAQPTDDFPPKAKPSEAGWGFYKGWASGWAGLHQKLLARTAQGGVDILFLGDSLTALWDKEGKTVWDARFAPLKAANYGIGGNSTRQVIWRLENGEIDNLNPKLVVLMIGTNNIYSDHNSGTDAEITEGVAKIVGLIHAKAPAAKVLLLGVLPRQNAFFTNRTAALNKELSAYASKSKIQFIDASAKFLNAGGTITPALFKSDQVHLSTEGYTILADAIQPAVTALLKP
ncbi:GDSL-type esterase/lipase family protein [Rariglobus hedericola]|uniref:GDSL family lipase n=1 Tax=Rariglobus hedericola TaxID=2597822 RepID=A0A556QL18_9BACT|nr:GDSL-type esterase/lipase family protein [Rariglobus hedericola]TSJ77317.1 GDSL family lipase [Rariglobus hedericola]